MTKTNKKAVAVESSHPNRKGAARPTQRGNVSPQKKESSTQARASIEMLSVWKHEVEALKSRRFQDFSAAVDAVVEKVSERLKADADTSEFLRLLLTSDPTIEAELRKSLLIRETD